MGEWEGDILPARIARIARPALLPNSPDSNLALVSNAALSQIQDN